MKRHLWALTSALAVQGSEPTKLQQQRRRYLAQELNNWADTTAIYNRSLADYQLGNYAAAASGFASLLERVTSEAPLRGRVAANLGNSHARLQQWNEAITAYNRALEWEPGNAAYRENLEWAKIQAQDTAPSKPQPQPADPKNDPSHPEDTAPTHREPADATSAQATPDSEVDPGNATDASPGSQVDESQPGKTAAGDRTSGSGSDNNGDDGRVQSAAGGSTDSTAPNRNEPAFDEDGLGETSTRAAAGKASPNNDEQKPVSVTTLSPEGAERLLERIDNHRATYGLPPPRPPSTVSRHHDW